MIPNKLPDDSPKGKNVEQLLKERKDEYGNTWLIAGKVVHFITAFVSLDKIVASGYIHNWVLILSKLIRALFTPDHIDHWQDMAGYATLVAEDLKTTNNDRWRHWSSEGDHSAQPLSSE
jgi:ABC-type phosphate/phosphonate transport system permease subunit